MTLSFVNELFQLLLTETMHQFTGFSSYVRLRIRVKDPLDVNLAMFPSALIFINQESLTTGVSYS